jgi:hypothetical protein
MDIKKNFIDAIDCNFPYQNIELSKSLILEARNLGMNAICSVCYELCNIPEGIQVPQENLLLLFAFIKEDELLIWYEFIWELIYKHLSGISISENELLEAMWKVESLDGEHLCMMALLWSLDKNYSDKIERTYFDYFGR